MLFWGMIFLTLVADADDQTTLSATVPPPIVNATAVWSMDRARAGDRIALAVVMEITKGYHINADAAQLKASPTHNPFPTRIRIPTLPPHVTIGKPQFPQPQVLQFGFSKKPLAVFDGRIIVYLPVAIAPPFDQTSLRIKMAISYQACDDATCLMPETIELTAELPAAPAGTPPRAMAPEIFDGMAPAGTDPGDRLTFSVLGWDLSMRAPSFTGMAILLIMAAFGGLLLNLTPCVLPLIPIKILSLSNAAQNRARCLTLGWATFAGMLMFWLLLGLAIAMVSAFTATNQLFQYPAFTIAIGLIMTALGVGMIRSFAIPLPGFIYRLNPDEGTLAGAFATGTLSAILATPCTAPFMGAAAALAATQHPGITLAVFGAIGTGMALPYLILSAAPRLVQRMPRGGPAGIVIKQVLGLFMLAAAAYFLGAGWSALAAAPPDPPSNFYWWIVMGFSAGGGLWTVYRSLQLTQQRLMRTICVLTGMVVFGVSVYGGLRFTDKGPIDWIYYTEERFANALAERRTVVMVFTAAWCLNCKALEQSVLNRRSMAELLERPDVVPIKVDITGRNPMGRERLERTGHLSIPLLVVYSPDGREIMKRSFYTAAEVIAAVEEAHAGR
jgi:thiol:disulfide interchange protein DsbD